MTHNNQTAFIFAHGSWHGAWAWNLITTALNNQGFQTFAMDLPGHGLDAKLPASYLKRPLDKEAFAKEPSPIAKFTAQDYGDKVLESVAQAQKSGAQNIYLVGHSMGGVAVTFAAAKLPEAITGLVYLTAVIPIGDAPGGKYIGMAEQMANSKIINILLSDAAVSGALRMDSASSDSAYRARMKEALMADVPDDLCNAVMNLCTPDAPAVIYGEVPDYQAGFDKIPRYMVRCTEDKLLLPLATDAMIADMKASYPNANIETFDMASSHEVIFSKPDEIVALLVKIAV